MSHRIATHELRPPAPAARDAGRDPAARERDARERQLAWQRAMEQAGCSFSFHRVSASTPCDPRTVASGPRAPGSATVRAVAAAQSNGAAVMARAPDAMLAGAGRHADRGLDPTDGRQATSGLQPTRSRAMSAARGERLREAPARGDGPAPAPSATAGVAPLLPEPAWNASARGDVEATGRELSPPPGAERAPSGDVPRDGERLRLHVESSDDGIRVWVGADGRDASSLEQWTPALVHGLDRWAMARGSRLLAVVCNGRAIFQRDAADEDHAAAGREHPRETRPSPEQDASTPAVHHDQPEDVPWR